MRIHEEYIKSIIPHRLEMVDIMDFALTKMSFKEGALVILIVENRE